jgi:hypothetical protein
MNGREPKCGWISTQQFRTYQAYKTEFSQGKDCIVISLIHFRILEEQAAGPDQTHSIFPSDNYELENVRWEDDIILDPDNMPSIPSTRNFIYRFKSIFLEPRILTLEYEDDPAIFGMPEDISLEERNKEDGNRAIDRKVILSNKMIYSQKLRTISSRRSRK